MKCKSSLIMLALCFAWIRRHRAPSRIAIKSSFEYQSKYQPDIFLLSLKSSKNQLKCPQYLKGLLFIARISLPTNLGGTY